MILGLDLVQATQHFDCYTFSWAVYGVLGICNAVAGQRVTPFLCQLPL